jgi:signal peptidase I
VSDAEGSREDASSSSSDSVRSDSEPASASSSEPVAESANARPAKRGGALREVALIIVVALVLSALVRTFLFQAFWIPSGSMEDTLLPDDRILVSKLTTQVSGIERGEVVVFEDPSDWLTPTPETGTALQRTIRDTLEFVGLAPARSDRDLVKRVIGVGGDRVVCCDAQGRITVNGQPLDETSYLYPGDKPSEESFDVTVPAGSLWVMGDHRSASGDSRFHLDDPAGPFVPEDRVVGRAMWVVWPFGRWSTLPIPETFGSVPAPSGTPTAAPSATP